MSDTTDDRLRRAGFGLQQIFECQPDEEIVTAFRFRDYAMIATTRNVYEWRPEDQTMQVVEIVTVASRASIRGVVYAAVSASLRQQEG